MTRRLTLKQMAWFTVQFLLAAAIVGYFAYEDAVTEEELTQEIKRAAQRGYQPKGE